MATTALASNGEDANCCICNELFDTPKLLPCSHTVCRQCLLNWLEANPKGLCPLCRRAIGDTKQQGGQAWRAVVDNLPTDLAMDAVITSIRVLKENHACVGCRNNAAVSICLTCADKYCRTCCDVHKNSSLSRDHKVEDLSTMTPEQLAASQPAFCSFHSDKPAELFCPTHGAAICHLCASAKHRSCPDVAFFENRVEELREELAGMSTTLKAAEGVMDNVIKQLDQQLAKMETVGQEALDHVDADFDRLENALKACRHRLKERVLSSITKIKDKVKVAKDTSLERKEGLTTHRVSADRVKRAMPAKFLNDVNPILKSKIEDLNLTAALPSDVKAVSMTDLTIDRKALEIFEKELNNLDLGQTTQPSAIISPVPAQAKLVKKQDEESLDNKLCTFTITQKRYMKQPWYHCHTCKLVSGLGVCVVCASVCHKDHHLSSVKYANCFCDCGAKMDGSCKALVQRPAGSGGTAQVTKTQQEGSKTQQASPKQNKSMVWQFHCNRGDNIELSSKGQTATYTGSGYYGHGVIMASKPMEVNVVYEVQLEERNDSFAGSLFCGVVISSTAVLSLPETAYGWNYAIVFSGGGNLCDRGIKKLNRALGDRLRNLSEGDRVGVVIDDEGSLQLLINSAVIISWPRVATPCFAFFQLHRGYSKVTTLPLRSTSSTP